MQKAYWNRYKENSLHWSHSAEGKVERKPTKQKKILLRY